MTTTSPVSPVRKRSLRVATLTGTKQSTRQPGAEESDVRALQVLAVQAAIALEQRVAERTQHLAWKNAALEKATQAAEAANRAKSTFLANMSHEIRTSLNVILGYAHIVAQDPEINARHSAAITAIASSGQHLLGLLNDVLDLSRIEAGRMELQGSDFDLQALVDGIAEIFAVRCQEKGLTWRVEWCQEGKTLHHNTPHARLVVHGDESKLRQVFMNLLCNAVKCTAAGAVTWRLDLTPTTHDAVQVTCDVVDTGIGISAAEQARIFSAFDRGASTARQEGTGLGLTIAQKHVELMGGRLAVDSTPGLGARFYFTLSLPLALGASRAGEAAQTVSTHLAPGETVHALVVDDVADNRTILVHMLQAMGVDVTTAENGQQALQAIAAHRPDIVFMDIWLPLMDGVAAAQHIIATYGAARPKLVAVSASVLQHEQERYLAAGFDAFLAKPLVALHMYQVLARLLRVTVTDETAVPATSARTAVVLPQELVQGIQQAAETYRVTQLDRYFDAVANLGPTGQHLAARLYEHKQRGDMHGIVALLADCRPPEKDSAGEATPRNSDH